MQAVPSTTPESMQSTVLVPMVLIFPAPRPMEGSSEAEPDSASSEILTPGRMAPPIKLRSSVTTVILVAVPRSMMMAGRGYFSAAPTAVQARSAPREAGSSMRILRPVLTPGPTTMVGISPKMRTASLKTVVSAGTTEEMAAPVSRAASKRCRAKICESRTAYSVSLRRGSVLARAVKRGVLPS